MAAWQDDLLKLSGAGGGPSSSAAAATVSPWIRLDLPSSSSPSPSPFYLKLLLHLTSYPSSSSSETRLVAILTDLKTGLYSETFESARSIQVRLRVSNNSPSTSSEATASTLEHLDQAEAVETLFTQVKDWYGHVGPKASLEVRNDDELELLVHLESLAFRFRMDKVSSTSLQIRILHDLLLQPALALIQTLMTFAPQGLQATQEAIDSTATRAHQPDPVLLAAVERYAQAAAGQSLTDRIEIKPLPRKQGIEKNRKSKARDPGETAAPPEKMEIDDPDATIDSVRASISPGPSNAAKGTGKGKGKEREASASASPPPAIDITGNEQQRNNDNGEDSDATQASENHSADEEEEKIHISHSSKQRSKNPIARSPTPDSPPPSNKRKSSVSPPAAAESPSPPSRKAAKTAEGIGGEKIPKAPAPSVPVLARASAAAARGRGRGRGTAAGQWTRFG